MSRESFMEAALDQARLALAAGEVPIGAVLVIDGQIVARGFNQPIASCDPTAHAEILVLRDAARIVGNYRLTDADVYVTVEPCLMCVGALVHARVRDVIFGATEPRTGALISTMRALETPGLNHRFTVTSGVLDGRCLEIVQEFFRDKRRRARDAPPADSPNTSDGPLLDIAFRRADE
jgi:tRNA(adenine34) deaminase